MLKKLPHFSLVLCFLGVIPLSSAQTFVDVGVPVPDEKGNETGLYNMNPDPAGEPWIVGGALPVTEEEQSQMIEFLPAPISGPETGAAMPDKVDNSKLIFFPPVLNQKGSCCCQASGISYTFTYEMNFERNLDAKLPEHQYPYGFTYNFINAGNSNNYSSYSEGWAIAKELGIPNVRDYGGTLYGNTSQTSWMSGYDAYYSAMGNRYLETIKIDVRTVSGLQKLKQYLFDHGDGSISGGVVNFLTDASGMKRTTLPAGTPEAGHTVVTKFGTSGAHCMTFAGYNDSIRVDLNGDGKFTNNIDIDGNGAVDMKDWEIGGLLMVNSFGTSWGTGGRAYVMYNILPLDTGGVGGRVHGIRVKKTFSPQLGFKATVTHTTRNKIRIIPGIATDTKATHPSKTLKLTYSFKNAGGALPMEGKGLGSTIEIGLDATELMTGVTAKQVVYFLQIVSTGGSGAINKFSVIDYSSGAPVEFVCPQKDIVITANDTTTISILRQDATAARSALDAIAADRGRPLTFSLYRPDGRKIMTLRGEKTAERIIRGLNGFRTMPAGVYLIKSQGENGAFLRTRLIGD